MLIQIQKDALNKIKSQLEQGNRIIHIEGPEGSGKSTIIKKYLDEVKDYEDWCIYYFEGIEGTSTSFSTIKNSTKFTKANSKISTVNLTFKIPFTPLSIGTSFQEISLADIREDFIYQQISKETASNIMIVIDSFQYADPSSSTFFIDLKNSISKNAQKQLLDKTVYMIFVRDKILREETPNYERNFQEKIIQLEKIDVKNLKQFIDIITPAKTVCFEEDLNTIFALSNGNLEYIKVLCEEYFQERSAFTSNENTELNIAIILEKRLERLGDKKNEVLNLLEVSSIFNDHFKTESLQSLMKSIVIEPLLAESCDSSFLIKSNHFKFFSPFIKNHFYKRIERSYQIRKLALDYYDYMQTNEPENYLTRAHYLSLANQHEDYTSEIFGLFCLAYFRSMETPFGQTERENIINKLINFDKALKTDSQKKLQKYFENLKNAHYLYQKEQYIEALKELEDIISCDSILLLTEIERWKLIILLMTESDVHRIYSATRNLENVLPLLIKEKEQLLKCQFVLFSTYSNKLDDFEKSRDLGFEMEMNFNKNSHSDIFEYFQKLLFRKSCVYKDAIDAKKLTNQSLIYFKDLEDHLQYYLALCNHSGNQIILGDYSNSLKNLEACFVLIKKYPFIVFPSQNKVKNNYILANFLNFYSDLDVSEEESIKKALNDFYELGGDHSYEANAITAINMINLEIMNGDFKKASQNIEQLKETSLLNNENTFYEYYINSLFLALNVMQKNWDMAEVNVNKIKDSCPNFFKANKNLILSRNRALVKLVENKISLSPREIDKWVTKTARARNPAGDFYCRLFLFSDLQFTSI